ncbi:MAG: bifunctional diaminohydroxyphosphoribosylaminopyrimidine deaminase/5-amino-6-(5-phosphoribosylamino)uracil reductase RibD [Succinivibrionaceae bacterium]|nr:bifunctional diaminohydroxyphosphoribosylaminopyrimidine deaminase/5-amino-6-(5-phosphoribosylamino)uracil reductase RibD [Succinivibrionaceae bacterium]
MSCGAAGAVGFSEFDTAMMRRALALAEKGVCSVTPNPAVGCVIVRDGNVIGEGYHKRAGTGHAEVNAIASAGGDIRGADVYVTLEPCSHYGRTPPCAETLIRAGARRVVAAMKDPNPMVAGRGLAMLSEAGVETRCGLLEHEAELLNPGFLHRMRTGRPYVRLKMGCSIDGRTALADGSSKWITSAEARRDVQSWRARSCCILTTSATVLADDPSMNVRPEELPEGFADRFMAQGPRQPALALVDEHRRVPSGAAVFKTERPVIRFTSSPEGGQEVFYRRQNENALADVFRELGRRQMNSVWIEAGATFAGSVIAQDLADEIIIYLAPRFIGADGRPLAAITGCGDLASTPFYEVTDCSMAGRDIRVTMERKRG